VRRIRPLNAFERLRTLVINSAHTQVLIQTEFSEPRQIYTTSEDCEQTQTGIVRIVINELIKELLASEKFPRARPAV
jgi:hypothetical protein